MTTSVAANPDELTEVLANPSTWSPEMRSKNGMRDYLSQYGKNLLAKDEGIMTQVREEVQRGMAQFMKDFAGAKADTPRVDLTDSGAPRFRGFANQAPVGQGFPYGSYQAQKQCLYNKAAMGAPLDKVANSFPEFLQGVAAAQKGTRFRNNQALLDTMAKLTEIQTSFSTDAPSDGGFLVPEEFRSDL